MSLLIVEDDEAAAEHVREALVEAGHDVVVAADGPAALELGGRRAFDVLIIDRMLPGKDGLSLLRELRGLGVDAPALFVTALGAVADRVAGLEAGGDDYLVKPFAFAELKARVQALGRRRTNARPATLLQFADLTLDRVQREVRRAGAVIDLQPLEFRLLEFLLLNLGQPVTRKMLLEEVWGFRFDPRTNIVETHLSRLRGKIDRAGGEPLIRTIRGAGYVIGG
ncbi:response regulator transcription factor [Phenylobacterium sp.]|uniref:response regulator transcription factor n=1 Tax=Phenylobacterium sp. TaxID=1871053 RepID=UPI0035B4F25F